MPAAPFFIAIAGASGLTATIGTAIASTIGIGTVSAATALAIGTGAITGTLAIAEGKKFDDVLKAAVVGGLTSYVGANIADTISNDVFWKSIDGGITGTTAKVIADAIGQGVGGAIQGGITAIAYDQDPIDAMVKSGLTAGLSAGVRTAIDAKLSDVPGFKPTNDPVELTFQRALKSAVAAGLVGGDIKDSVSLSLMTSAGEALGKYARTALVDRSKPLEDSSKKYTSDYTALADNVSQQKYWANLYDERVQAINSFQPEIDAAKSEYELQKTFFREAVDRFEENKWAVENYDKKLESLGYQLITVADSEGGANYSSWWQKPTEQTRTFYVEEPDGEGSRTVLKTEPIWLLGFWRKEEDF